MIVTVDKVVDVPVLRQVEVHHIVLVEKMVKISLVQEISRVSQFRRSYVCVSKHGCIHLTM